MHYSPLETETGMLQSMTATERMHYALTRMLECEEVWSLGDSNGWVISENCGQQLIPVWPYQLFAEQYLTAVDASQAATPQAISLEQFVYRALQMCSDNDVYLNVFPLATENGVLMAAGELYRLLGGMLESEAYVLEG